MATKTKKPKKSRFVADAQARGTAATVKDARDANGALLPGVEIEIVNGKPVRRRFSIT